MKPKTKKRMGIVLLFVLIVAAGAGYYIYKEYNRKLIDTARLKADHAFVSNDLLAAFEKNEKGSFTAYSDKVISVSGMVKDVSKDDKGFYSVVLGDTASLSSVRCSMDSVHNNEAAALQRNQPVTMKGICSGFNRDEMLGSDVILVRCVVESPKTKN